MLEKLILLKFLQIIVDVCNPVDLKKPLSDDSPVVLLSGDRGHQDCILCTLFCVVFFYTQSSVYAPEAVH